MLLHIIMLLVITYTSVSQKPSPCPEIFSYEQNKSETDRWYGEIRYSTTNNVTGIWLQVILDRPADILGNWFGQVTTCDNTVYAIRKPGYTLQPGQYFTLRFFVKFNLAKTIPSLVEIKLNGNGICNTEKDKPKNVVSTLSEPIEKDPVAKLTKLPSTNSRLTTQVSSTDSKCGIAATRATQLIFHGQQTSPGQWPWHAALYHHEDFEIKYACGATLITQRHVITAAHCVNDAGTKTVKDRSDVSMGLGKYNLKTFEEDFQHVGVSNIYVHPKYNPWKTYNDIAILKLSGPVQVTDYVRPCCLWDGDPSLANIIGEKGTVVGWGISGNVSHQLMQATMPIVSTEDCIFSKKEFREFLHENNFCAGNRNGTSACRGDSGGGMVFPKKDENGQTVWYLRGIVSLSLVPEMLQLCETSNYNIFTDVAKFSQWIKNVINDS